MTLESTTAPTSTSAPTSASTSASAPTSTSASTSASAPARILIGGDVCPVEANRTLFESGDVDELLGADLARLINESAGLLFNLEVPLVDERSPIVKSGPTLIAPTTTVEALKKMNVRGVSLANNHILDQGERGLASTFRTLDAAGIPRFGAAETEQAARRPLVFEADGLTIGVYACADHEFSIAGPGKAGANPFDPLTSLSDITRLSHEVDRVIILYHGMREFHPYPSPDVRRRCRAMVDAGAHLVLCQHSHCIGCTERYEGADILYGQGDFCIMRGRGNPQRETGLLVAYDPRGNAADFLPLLHDGRVVRLAEGAAAETILQDFRMRSAQIEHPGFVDESWRRFCRDHADEYAEQIALTLQPAPLSLLVRVLRKVGATSLGRKVARISFGRGSRIASLLNALQCEAHNEALRTILAERLHED